MTINRDVIKSIATTVFLRQRHSHRFLLIDTSRIDQHHSASVSGFLTTRYRSTLPTCLGNAHYCYLGLEADDHPKRGRVKYLAERP